MFIAINKLLILAFYAATLASFAVRMASRAV